MGCCYSFIFGNSSSTSEESRPLLGDRSSQPKSGAGGDGTAASAAEEAASMQRAYEAVTADAHRIFLSSSTRRGIASGENEELKAKLSAATVDNTSFESDPIIILNPSRVSSDSVMEILSDPVTLNSTYSNLADELGDAVAKYALNLKVDDTSSPVVGAFKSLS